MTGFALQVADIIMTEMIREAWHEILTGIQGQLTGSWYYFWRKWCTESGEARDLLPVSGRDRLAVAGTLRRLRAPVAVHTVSTQVCISTSLSWNPWSRHAVQYPNLFALLWSASLRMRRSCIDDSHAKTGRRPFNCKSHERHTWTKVRLLKEAQ